jgi:hypothetical protein
MKMEYKQKDKETTGKNKGKKKRKKDNRAEYLTILCICICPVTPYVLCYHLLQFQIIPHLRASNTAENHSKLTALTFIVLVL